MDEYIRNFFSSIMTFLISEQEEEDFTKLKHDYILMLYSTHYCRENCQICGFLLDELEKFEKGRN